MPAGGISARMQVPGPVWPHDEYVFKFFKNKSLKFFENGLFKLGSCPVRRVGRRRAPV
jgi:hypothetical protein